MLILVSMLVLFIIVSQIIMILCFLKKKMRRGIRARNYVNYFNDSRSISDSDLEDLEK